MNKMDLQMSYDEELTDISQELGNLSDITSDLSDSDENDPGDIIDMALVPLYNTNNNANSCSDENSESEDEDLVVARIKENIKEKVREELKDEIQAIATKTANLEEKYGEGSEDFVEDHGEDLDKLEPKLKKAILKMRRLDRILQGKEQRERAVKRDRILLHRSLCKELRKKKAFGRKETQDELTNMEKYLALELPPSHNEGVNLEEDPSVPPLFDTQPRENDLLQTENSPTEAHANINSSNPNSSGASKERCRAASMNSLDSDDCSELGNASSSCASKVSGIRRERMGASKDFITRNIELASDADSTLAMTDDEKSRIKQLLADIDEEPLDAMVVEEDNPYQVCLASAGEGFLPDVSDRQTLERIDSRLKELLPEEEYLSLCGSSADLTTPVQLFSRSFVPTSRAESLGEPTLQVVHDDRTLQQRLKCIDEDLDSFYSRTVTPEDSCCMSEDRLSSLLDDCARQMLPSIVHRDEDEGDDRGTDTQRSDIDQSRQSLMSNPPRLSEEVLNALLEEARMEQNRRISQQSHTTPRRNIDSSINSSQNNSPYIIHRDIDYNIIHRETDNDILSNSRDGYDSDDDNRSPFLPEIQSRVSLVSNSNVQSFSARSRVSLQSVRSEDFD